MLRFSLNLFALIFLSISACQPNGPSTEKRPPINDDGRQTFFANYGTPVLDGSASDDIWEQCTWLDIDQVWLGETPTPDDFTGKYKLAWDENNLYILAEITDDSLVDTHPNGLQKYWDDDCLEIFIDEDASGGNHQYNFNAFAYHIALDGKVVDIAPDSAVYFFENHILTRRLTRDNVSTWEIAVRIFDGGNYQMAADNVPKLLSKGKKMGFAIAYNDNDSSPEREHFVGSVAISGENKNQGWIDASVFGILELK